MRLYVNTKEVPHLKSALANAITVSESPIERNCLTELLARVSLCEELQKSEKRARAIEQL